MDNIEQALKSLIQEHGSPNVFYVSEVGILCSMSPQEIGREMRKRGPWIELPSLICFVRYYYPGEVCSRDPAYFQTFGEF